jgi:hypothetical protein
VRNIYEMNEAKNPSGGGEGDEAKLVLIGKAVEQQGFRESLIDVLG